MTYPLEIDIHEPIEAAIDDLVNELEEALFQVRKYARPEILHTHEVDVHDLLADHQAIGIVWDVHHVRDQRPDLTAEQAWEVLQAIEHDRLNDPLLETIRLVAENLYPTKRKICPAKAGAMIANYGDGTERDNLVNLLTDLMHWCEGFGEPFAEFSGSAQCNFIDETKKGA